VIYRGRVVLPEIFAVREVARAPTVGAAEYRAAIVEQENHVVMVAIIIAHVMMLVSVVVCRDIIVLMMHPNAAPVIASIPAAALLPILSVSLTAIAAMGLLALVTAARVF